MSGPFPPWLPQGGGHIWAPHRWRDKEVMSPLYTKAPAKWRRPPPLGVTQQLVLDGQHELPCDEVGPMPSPSILTLTHTSHLPVSNSAPEYSTSETSCPHSAVLPPEPLLWALLGGLVSVRGLPSGPLAPVSMCPVPCWAWQG